MDLDRKAYANLTVATCCDPDIGGYDQRKFKTSILWGIGPYTSISISTSRLLISTVEAMQPNLHAIGGQKATIFRVISIATQ